MLGKTIISNGSTGFKPPPPADDIYYMRKASLAEDHAPPSKRNESNNMPEYHSLWERVRLAS